MAINVTPIPKLAGFAAPGFTLGTANTAGSATTAVASNSTLQAFDAVDPAAVAATAAVGTATVTARRDHVHAGTPATAEGVAKGFVRVEADGSKGDGDYNVGSITNGPGTGRRQINWTTDFANTDYICLGNQFFDNNEGATLDWDSAGMAVGSITFRIRKSDATYSLVDMASCNAGFGEQ